MENRESIAELGIRDVSNKLEVECPTETRCEEPGKEHGKEIDFVKSAGYSKRRKRRTKKQKSGHSFVLDVEEEESRGVEESSDRRTTTPENLLMMAINLESVRGEQRKGYDKDDAKLKRICKRLGDNCKLIKFNEVKSETMKEFYWKLRESSEGCSIISIFVLSHGNYNSFCLSDGTSLNISTFIDRVTSVVKPKKLWCAFVFCQIYKEYGSISEPNYENAVISYSTSPGCRSCRLGEEGSIYMTSLEKSISKYGITKVMFNRVKHFTKVQARRHGELQCLVISGIFKTIPSLCYQRRIRARKRKT